jgi:hypothetical protein
MAIDVDALVSDAALDTFLGGRLNGQTSLKPRAWADSKPARQFALDAILRYFRDATPTITEDHITDPSVLGHAVMQGAATRLYELALQGSPDSGGFATLYKNYKAEFEREVRKQIDIAHAGMAPDRKGRGRRTVAVVRR